MSKYCFEQLGCTTFHDRLRRWARRDPTGVAVRETGSEITYAGLLEAAERFAAGLAARGYGPGDAVVVQPPNCIQALTAVLGMTVRGVVPVMALPTHRAAELAHMCRVSGARALFVPHLLGGFDHTSMAGALRGEFPALEVWVFDDAPAGRAGAASSPAACAEGAGSPFPSVSEIDAEPAAQPSLDPASPALMLLSGGTTGMPKLIPRTHEAYLYNAAKAAERLMFGPRTVYLAALSMSHNFPLACPGILGTFEGGGCVVMTRSASPDEAFPLIGRFGVTDTALVPSLAQLWVEARAWFPCDLSSLKELCVGGARFSEEDARRTADGLGCAVEQAFGLTEGILCLTDPRDGREPSLATQGTPISELDRMIVADASGTEVPRGEEGVLLWEGPYLMEGYYRNPAANAESFVAPGRFDTGDLARIDADGRLHITGRAKNVINRAGEKFSAEEVENALMLMPGVVACAVSGVADARLGEAVCAFVVGRGGAGVALEDVRAACADAGLATYKHPDRVVNLRELPLTAIGKVDVKALRRAAEAGEL